MSVTLHHINLLTGDSITSEHASMDLSGTSPRIHIISCSSSQEIGLVTLPLVPIPRVLFLFLGQNYL